MTETTSRLHRLLVVPFFLAISIIIVSACGTVAGDVDSGRADDGGVIEVEPVVEVAGAEPDRSAIPIRRAVGLGQLRPDDRPVPVRLAIDGVGIEAPVRSVGVEVSGDLELPAGSEIGWYRFGPTPGEQGSAVLAAHVDWNGVPGAFFALQDTAAGQVVSIDFDDGSRATFAVVAVRRYGKDELPLDQVFAREGEPVLTLITCGGDFNPALRTYADNVVVVARPI